MIVLGIWFVLLILKAFIASGLGGAAWHAHIAGFLAGVFLIGWFHYRDVLFGGGRGVRYP